MTKMPGTKVERERTVRTVKGFVENLLRDDLYDYIVPVERKGTALIRAALHGLSSPRWDRVISSRAIEETDWSGRVLLFDDSARRGASLQTLKTTIIRCAAERGRDVSVTTASVMSHLKAPLESVDISCYRGLDDDSYEEGRTTLVEYLRAEGSLLLDTEHLDIQIQFDGPASELFEAAAGWGDAVAFPSTEARINLTVNRQMTSFREQFGEVKPDFALLDSSVCKVRLVTVPSQPGRFSIIPICFPSLSFARGCTYKHPRMKWTTEIRDERRIFDCVGLSMSLTVLGDFFVWIKTILGSRLEVVEQPGIGHIKAIFPEMREDEVRRELERELGRKAKGAAKRAVFDDIGYSNIQGLARTILDSCYDSEIMDENSDGIKALCWAEILNIAQLEGQTDARASAALDLLIDEAKIRPDVEMTEESLLIMMRRVYRPDGEIVRREVIRHALLAGRGMATAGR